MGVLVVDLRTWIRGKPQTRRVYLENSYLREVDATIVDYVCEKRDKCYVVFDTTIFHPRSGGQPSDTGELLSGELRFQVLKVLEFSGVIVHYGKLIEGVLERGLIVRQVLNWSHRYLTMRLHTAGHVLDYAVMKLFGKVLNTVDAHHGEPEAYIVYESNVVPRIYDLKLIEEYANNVVRESRAVKTYWVSREELLTRVYNAPNLHRLPVLDSYRVVEIENVNAIPCTGTHVKNTVEVGEVRVIKVEGHEAGFKLQYSVT